jgi:protoporphyrin/coproporphyrin ferrochelatase
MKTGVLLINLGTPDSPSNGDVRKYLTEFLNDPRVIDISPVSRWMLVNLVIIPFRAPKTAALYQKVWTKEGSPLLVHSLRVREKLQHELGDKYVVELGMRYRNPSIGSALDKLREAKVDRIIAIPLYPQYASSSTGTAIERMMKEIERWEVTPSVSIISRFYDDPGFIDSLAEVAKGYDLDAYDHILFSYHGLPERQIKKASAHYGSGYCQLGKCCNTINKNNQYCYRANCFETTRQLAQRLNIPEEKYTVSFQSRLGRDPWVKPYSDEVIVEKAKAGAKKLLVFSPAFVSDCLETIYEIGVEYDHLFREHGGEKVQLVESLNTHPRWIQALKEMVLRN